MINKFLTLLDSLEKINTLLLKISTSEEAIHKDQIQYEIEIENWETPFRGPYFDCEKRKIVIHERFLVFLWCSCYSIFFKTESNHDEQYFEEDNDGLLDKNNPDIISLIKLIEWSIQIQRNPEKPFPSICPNPDNQGDFSIDITDFIHKSTKLFETALLFYIFHEIAHAILNHCPENDTLNISKELSALESKLIENEADIFSRRLLKSEFANGNAKFQVHFGILMALISMLFCLEKPEYIKGLRHPDTDERILRCFRDFDNISEAESDYFAEAIIGGIQIYLDIFKTDLNIELTIEKWNENRETVLEDILKILDQIKKRSFD